MKPNNGERFIKRCLGMNGDSLLRLARTPDNRISIKPVELGLALKSISDAFNSMNALSRRLGDKLARDIEAEMRRRNLK
jgi:hypothetical protein